MLANSYITAFNFEEGDTTSNRTLGLHRVFPLNVLLPAFPTFELARGLGADEPVMVASGFKTLPNDPVVFVMCAYPDP